MFGENTGVQLRVTPRGPDADTSTQKSEHAPPISTWTVQEAPAASVPPIGQVVEVIQPG